MSIRDLRDDAINEIATILDSDFDIEVIQTKDVPHADDASITFANLDDGYQRCKMIETAVLYIDIRRSTELSLQHKPETVAKLYSAFVRSMTNCAIYYNGHVRGIVGDRIMVLFNPSSAFSDAVNTAVLMHSVIKYILNVHFTKNEVSCGIGIDYGRMLVTKTGIRRNGVEQQNYRSLVWLGRPANIASKLTDVANKTTHHSRNTVREGLHFPLTQKWHWSEMGLKEFLERMKLDYSLPSKLVHQEQYFGSFYLDKESWEKSFPPILMTEAVYDGFRQAAPEDESITNGWWQQVKHSVPEYSGKIYGGNLIFKAFKEPK